MTCILRTVTEWDIRGVLGLTDDPRETVNAGFEITITDFSTLAKCIGLSVKTDLSIAETDITGSVIVYPGGKYHDSRNFVSVDLTLKSPTAGRLQSFHKFCVKWSHEEECVKHKPNGLHDFNTSPTSNHEFLILRQDIFKIPEKEKPKEDCEVNKSINPPRRETMLDECGNLTIKLFISFIKDLLQPAPKLVIAPTYMETTSTVTDNILQTRSGARFNIPNVLALKWKILENEFRIHKGLLEVPMTMSQSVINNLAKYCTFNRFDETNNFQDALSLAQFIDHYLFEDNIVKKASIISCKKTMITELSALQRDEKQNSVQIFAIGHFLNENTLMMDVLPILADVGIEEIKKTLQYDLYVKPAPGLLQKLSARIKAYKNSSKK